MLNTFNMLPHHKTFNKVHIRPSKLVRKSFKHSENGEILILMISFAFDGVSESGNLKKFVLLSREITKVVITCPSTILKKCPTRCFEPPRIVFVKKQ